MIQRSIHRLVVLSLVVFVVAGGFATPVAAACDSKYNPCPDNPGDETPDSDELFPDSLLDEKFPDSLLDEKFPDSLLDGK